MRDITAALTRYRECVRHVWNAYFVEYAYDSAHDFINVDDSLFYALVLQEIARMFQEPERVDGYYPDIIVKYEVHPPLGFRVLVPEAIDDRTTRWQEQRLLQEDADLRYSGLFDFANAGDDRDFRYVRARAIQVPEHPALAGSDLLMDFQRLRFFTTRTEGTSDA